MTRTIALAGNPNSGKSTLFNRLTGSKQSVGNWPGVTLERKVGRLRQHPDVAIVDLPGVYSLSAYTLEERVARDYLLDAKPDCIINIVDGTNLERNLFLTTQLLELGIPVVIAVNMMDLVRHQGLTLDTSLLSRNLGVPVVEISASHGSGIDHLTDAVLRGHTVPALLPYTPEHEAALAAIMQVVGTSNRWIATQVFERDEFVNPRLPQIARVQEQLESIITRREDALDDDAISIMAAERYTQVTNVLPGSFTSTSARSLTLSDHIDQIVTNRWLALPIFAVVMFAVYYIAVTTVGTYVTDYTNDVIFGDFVPNHVAVWLSDIGTAEWLNRLVVEGIIGGVGAVLGFVPQLMLLFIFLAILEDSGYMARVAFIMDRAFRHFGLSGKSFIPMLIGTGCSVPGIMASRTIENERDRKLTAMTTSFIPCGAKLAVIALISGAIFQGAWWVAPSAYFVGMAAVILSGIILKKSVLFSGDPAPFVMELPPYHAPRPSVVLRSMWDRSWAFIRRAGTIILLATMTIWFLANVGWQHGPRFVDDLDNSFLAAVSGSIAWIFAPLGWGTWQSTAATLSGLVAKESVVGTFGVLYGVADVSDDGAEVWGQLAASFTVLAAYSFLLFNLLCAPCFAAIGAIRREMGNGRWTAFAVAYQTVFAWTISFIFYQVGIAIRDRAVDGWTILAVVALAGIVWLLVKKPARPRRAAVVASIGSEATA